MAVLRTAYAAPFKPPVTHGADTRLFAPAGFVEETAATLATDHKIYRMILGRDRNAIPLDLTQVHDPFATNILAKVVPLPLNLNALLTSFAPLISEKKVFHIAEDGQIPHSDQTQKLVRSFRLAIQLKVGNDPVFISTSKAADSTATFLQLMAWDGQLGAFNFYLRSRGGWFLAGSSKDALEPDTRGHGPFSGHVNGSPVMKELEQPWSHWHSSDSRIEVSTFPPDDPFPQTDLFTSRGKADDFEQIVRDGIALWNKARASELMKQLQMENPAVQPLRFMRQILDNPSINLASAVFPVSRNIQPDTSFVLPRSFFFNENSLIKLGIKPHAPQIKLIGKIYLKNLEDFGFKLVANETTWDQGDTHFAFLVPVPAIEDTDLLGRLLSKNIIAKNLAASLLMVDFPNSIYSLKRKALLQYLPSTMKSAANLTEKFVASVKQSSQAAIEGTAEHEFLQNWTVVQTNGWEQVFQTRIEQYLQKVQQVIQTQEGYNSIVTVAEYRRSLVRLQPIFEFELTLATTNISKTVKPCAFTEEAQVVETEKFTLEIQRRTSGMD